MAHVSRSFWIRRKRMLRDEAEILEKGLNRYGESSHMAMEFCNDAKCDDDCQKCRIREYRDWLAKSAKNIDLILRQIADLNSKQGGIKA